MVVQNATSRKLVDSVQSHNRIALPALPVLVGLAIALLISAGMWWGIILIVSQLIG